MSTQNNPPSVLIVDDMEASRFLIESLLKNEHITVTSAQSGHDAVELCKQNNFDIVLMDIVMPEIDGFRATQLIRDLEQQNLKSRSYIFAVSANDQPGDIQDCLNLGCDGHISKPINRRSLLKLLEEHSNFKSRSSP